MPSGDETTRVRLDTLALPLGAALLQIAAGSEAAPPHDARIDEYQQVGSQFRALTDIRFKLIGFLPAGTVAAVLAAEDNKLVNEPAVAIFGLLVTLCLATYSKRNDQLYSELMSRGAQLERELGLAHGNFSQRPAAWLSFGFVKIEHGWPVGFVYAVSAAIWTYVLVHAVTPDLPVTWRGVTFGRVWPWVGAALVLLVWLGLRKSEREKGERLKEAVDDLETPFKDLPHSKLITALRGNREIVRLFPDPKKAAKMIEGRLEATALEQARSKPEPARGEALALVLASVIDLPARWIHDRWTKRR